MYESKYYIHLPVVKLAPESLTERRDTLCLPKNNYLCIILKPVFIHLRVVDLVPVSLMERCDTLCLPNIIINTSLYIYSSISSSYIALTEEQSSFCLPKNNYNAL